MTTMLDHSQTVSAPVRGDERRGEGRQRALKGAVLSFNKGYGALECIVRDVSDHGARLRFGETSAVPPHFMLRIGRGGEPRPAVVKWRNLTDVGVHLDG